jgi:Flp pilus assembly protein TadG
MMLAISKRFGLNRSGAAAVEFSLVLPLLVILAFGGIEIGRMLLHHEIITKGVRNGVRYLTRVPVTCGEEPGEGSVADSEKQAAINLIKSGSTTAGTPVLAAYDEATFDVEVDCRANPDGLIGGTLLPLVRMTVQVPYDGMFMGIVGLNTTAFTVTHEELNVGE